MGVVMGVMSYKAVSNDDSAGPTPPPRPKRPEDRPTEDDIARESLGGPKGAPELKPAPMTRQRRIKTPESEPDPGHTE